MGAIHNNKSILVTSVYHGDQTFIVSTIERNSSSPACPEHRYNETIVWTENYGRMLHQGEACKGSISHHQRVVNELHNHGADGLSHV
jgi:hypothetical protein